MQKQIELWEKSPENTDYFLDLVQACRDNSMFQFAWLLLSTVKTQTLRFWFEVSIVAFYVNKKDVSAHVLDYLLLQQGSAGWTSTLQANYSFNPVVLSMVHQELKPPCPIPNFFCFNPSIVSYHGELHVNYRWSNYKFINAQFHSQINGKAVSWNNPIITHNLRGVLAPSGTIQRTDSEFWKFPPCQTHPNWAQGFEDTRLFVFRGELWYICTSLNVSPSQCCEMLIGTQTKLFRLQSPDPNRSEKNWLPFEHNNRLLLIYSWAPFVIYEMNPETGQTSVFRSEKPALQLSGFKGSTCPCRTSEGYLVVTHEQFKHPKFYRNYVHRIVSLNMDLEITHISPAFKLKNQHPVEYICGLTCQDDTVYMTWGEMDTRAYVSTLPLDQVLKFCRNSKTRVSAWMSPPASLSQDNQNSEPRRNKNVFKLAVNAQTSTTLVTAFYHIHAQDSPVGWSPTRQKQAEKFLSLDCPIVLYLQPGESQALREMAAGKANIHIRDCDLATLTASQIIRKANPKEPSCQNPLKDRFGFLHLINCKVEFVGMAAQQNPFNTTHFAWVDLCVEKMFRNPQSLETLRTSLISPPDSPVLLIPGCWSPGNPLDPNRVHWRFAGTVFLADRDSALSFSRIHQSNLARYLQKFGVISWEVNYWAWLEREKLMPASFRWKWTDHDDSMASSMIIP